MALAMLIQVNPAISLLLLFGVYALLGLLFALVFLTRGIARVDPTAHGSSLAFRLLILPGVVALWPVLLVKWAAVGNKGHAP